jgi:hypothetical protein
LIWGSHQLLSELVLKYNLSNLSLPSSWQQLSKDTFYYGKILIHLHIDRVGSKRKRSGSYLITLNLCEIVSKLFNQEWG